MPPSYANRDRVTRRVVGWSLLCAGFATITALSAVLAPADNSPAGVAALLLPFVGACVALFALVAILRALSTWKAGSNVARVLVLSGPALLILVLGPSFLRHQQRGKALLSAPAVAAPKTSAIGVGEAEDGRRSHGRIASERLLIVRDAGLCYLSRDPMSGAWQEREAVAFHDLVKKHHAFSGPVVSGDGRVFVALADYRSTSLDLYAWHVGQPEMAHVGSGLIPAAGGGSHLTSGVASQNLLLMAVPICEGYAGWTVARIMQDGTVRFGRLEDPLAASISEDDVAAYSPDGRLLVGASHGRLTVVNRDTGAHKVIQVPVSYFSAVSVSNDNRCVAWIGQQLGTERKEEVNEEGYIEGFPEVDSVGVVSLESGQASAWRAGSLPGPGFDPLDDFWDQVSAKIQISNCGSILYFTWGGGFVRLDTRTGSVERFPTFDFCVLPESFAGPATPLYRTRTD